MRGENYITQHCYNQGDYVVNTTNTMDQLNSRIDQLDSFKLKFKNGSILDCANYRIMDTKEVQNKIPETPNFRIIDHAFDGHKTTIWWSDNTTTTCYCRDDNADAYMGFYIACAKKVFGNNNTINNLAEKWIEKIPKQRAEAKAKAEAIAEREKQIEANKKKKREKNRIRIEAIKLKQEYEAKKLANEKYGVPLNYSK